MQATVRSVFSSLVLGLILVAVSTPSAVAAEAPRYYGNIPFALDLSTPGLPFRFSAQDLARDGNLVAIHMDWFGLPWPELAEGAPLPPAWSVQIDRIGRLVDELGLPVYLAVTPLDATRDRLASRAWGNETALVVDSAFGKRCEPISARPDAAALRAAFHAYVNLMVERLRPSFLALSIETNLYARACPDANPDLVGFLNAEYDAQKAAHPALPVFHTVQVDALWDAQDPSAPCFGFLRRCLEVNLGRLAGLKTDLLGLSLYPVAAFVNNGRRLPDDYVTAISALTGKTVAVAETGYPVATLRAPVDGSCVAALAVEDVDQASWVARVVDEADRSDMPFVVWWANHAPLPFATLAPCDCSEASPSCALLNRLELKARTELRFFGQMALRDYDGDPTPAAVAWSEAARPVGCPGPAGSLRPCRRAAPLDSPGLEPPRRRPERDPE